MIRPAIMGAVSDATVLEALQEALRSADMSTTTGKARTWVACIKPPPRSSIIPAEARRAHIEILPCLLEKTRLTVITGIICREAAEERARSASWDRSDGSQKADSQRGECWTAVARPNTGRRLTICSIYVHRCDRDIEPLPCASWYCCKCLQGAIGWPLLRGNCSRGCLHTVPRERSHQISCVLSFMLSYAAEGHTLSGATILVCICFMSLLRSSFKVSAKLGACTVLLEVQDFLRGYGHNSRILCCYQPFRSHIGLRPSSCQGWG